ncbi:MAG: hypothetical protein WB420_21110 [Bradyrhizobium sp.]
MTRLDNSGVLTSAGLTLAGLALGSALVRKAPSSPGEGRRARAIGTRPVRRADTSATVLAARRLNRAAGTLAASVLADSGIEHYRGSFKNKAMFTPLVVSGLTLATSIHGTADMRPVAHRMRDTTYLLAAATGLIGTGFHIYNVGKKTGGFSWQNLFYAAPLGAPMAILLSGLVGFCSERVRESEAGTRPEIFDMPAGRTMAAVVGAGLLGTTGEAGLLHFRGAYHNPFMALPVTLPPLGAILLASAAASGPGREHRFTRWWMRVLAAMGFAGVGFHAYGVSRNMGGWRNWTQNVLNGPPLPAPPSFAGLALAGLAALGLMKDHPDA